MLSIQTQQNATPPQNDAPTAATTTPNRQKRQRRKQRHRNNNPPLHTIVVAPEGNSNSNKAQRTSSATIMPARFEDVIAAGDQNSTQSGGPHHHHQQHQQQQQQQYNANHALPASPRDEIVITGFSGRLPESSSIREFRDNLYNGVDMVNDDPRRWPTGLYDLPARTGKIKDADLEQFDQQFFSVHQKQAECMDPQMRLLLESTYEAIIDAGLNPQDLRGTRTGVYVGCSNSEVEQYWCADPDRVNGYGLTGCARAMFANRLSFTFDFKGPSFATDTACSSALYAMDQAFADMRSGRCDAAIVAGSGLILKPTMSLQFKRLGMLSADGKCKAFDESGAGYVRSDGIVVMLMQKAPDARRVYASVLNVRTNTDGSKEQGITYPDGRIQNRLIRETYEAIGLHPSEVVYVEAHGTGTKVGDPQEVNSITDFFCKDRKTPLLLGSVKSNMGHSEPASGVCSIAKMLIAMEEGVIPGNLHFKSPNPDLYGIVDGRIKVVDCNTPWNGGIIGLNSFGFGGANAHVILKSNPRPKQLVKLVEPSVPRLVAVSGRSAEAIEQLLDAAEKHRDDEEFVGLLNDIHTKNIPMHFHRGYAVIGANGAQREVLELAEENRPVWYIYTGMGSQWAGMAKDLMQIDVFSNSIRRCADALRPEGLDLVDIITRNDEKLFDNILNSFVSIAAVQVALTDLLAHLGITPSGIIGHSVGELGCAYADGCFTAEQTVLAAFWRGKSIVDTKLIPGLMAAVGLTWEQCLEQLPGDVIPACHNSTDSVTISGPVDSVNKVIEDLTARGVFARAVKSSGIAFHSKYIADAGPKLRKSLDRIIPNPKNRTARWISSSIPESGWTAPMAQQSSAAYHVNNLLSQVLFHEALQHVPKNAICIEVAPTGLLQAILKRSLGASVTNLSLLKRGHENNLNFFLQNVGKLHAAGAQPLIPKLYRPVTYPVSRGTPMLNSLVGWDHSQRFMVPKLYADSTSGETVIEINLAKEEDSAIAGHIIDGRFLFPATGYITLVWRQFAKTLGSTADKTAVVIDDVVFHRPTIIAKDGSVKFGINFFEGTGRFELSESGSLTVSGTIRRAENPDAEQLPLEPLPVDTTGTALNTADVYKELRLRGYDYAGKFRGIATADPKATTGELLWDGNWICYMDTMLQFSILGRDMRELYLPSRIERVIIDPLRHAQLLGTATSVPVYMYKDINVIKSAGVEMRGLKASLAPRRSGNQTPKLERYAFVPFVNAKPLADADEAARRAAVTVSVQLVLENSGGALKLKVADVVGDKAPDNVLAQLVQNIIETEPTLVTDVALCTTQNAEPYVQAVGETGIRVLSKDAAKGPVEQNCHLVVAYDVTTHAEAATVLANLVASTKEDGFVLLEENIVGYAAKQADQLFADAQLVRVSEQRKANKFYILLRRAVDIAARNKQIIIVTEKSFDWVEQLKAALATAETEQRYVYLVSAGEELFGAVGLINCIKNETNGKWARLVYVQDKIAERFTFEGKLFAAQLRSDVLTSVYRGGAWGTFRHLRLECQTDVPTLQVEHAYVNALTKGDLASLNWIEGPLARLADDKSGELCTVYTAPINFRDVMLSSGKLAADALPGDLATQDCVLGIEFAGRDSSGKRVMAMVQGKSLATTCVAPRSMLWDVPDSWTIEQASTVPCVYSTVYYALVVRGRMQRGESILIHAGSGGVGQAAIAVALHGGLTVYTTVGSQAKRDYLKKTFPQLTDAHISNSRDTSFEQFVMRATKGRGVDLVLNSLSDDKLQASLRCLGLNGRFLEIGKLDLNNNTPLGMSVFLKNTSFHGILLDSIMETDNDVLKEVVDLVAEGIRSGAVRPLPTTVFSEKQIEQAFRYMASGKHIGKVVIKVRDEEPQKVVQPRQKLVNAIPRTYIHVEKSYVLVGGLGGFGLELTHWLVARGARNIVLNSRGGVRTGYQASMVRRWQERGVRIVIDKSDVTSDSGVEALLVAANRLAPVGGLFNLAAVLRDDILENLTAGDFEAVCLPKVTATKRLDVATRRLCKELDYFICFSSVSCGRGNIGQVNYGLANSAMERICESRQAAGLPGTAIQWGAIGDTGLVLENLGDNDTVIGGTLPQRMVSCLQTMDLFMQQPHAVLSSIVCAEKRKDTSSGVTLVKCVANILGLKDLKNVPDQASLADLGMDSLMGAEIKQTLERNYDVVLGLPEIRQLTFGKLKALESGDASGSTPTESGSVNGNGDNVEAVGDGNEVFFSAELLPTKVLVQLPSKAPADSTAAPLFVVHPIEGFVDALAPLASRLATPVWGLQCTAEAPLESLQQLAVYYVQHVKTIQAHGPYTIAGYSYGAAVAFEMVIELERLGEKAQLVLVDGSPKYVAWFTREQRSRASSNGTDNVSPSEAEALGLAYFGFVCAELNFSQTVKVLVQLKTFDDRLDAIAQLISKRAPKHSKELIKKTAQVFYKKLVAGDAYQPHAQAKSNVVLFKATDTSAKLSEDYGLAEHCKSEVSIVTLKGDHRTILNGESADQIVAVLNKLRV